MRKRQEVKKQSQPKQQITLHKPILFTVGSKTHVFFFQLTLWEEVFEGLQIFVQNNRLQNLPSFMWFRECRTHWLMAKTEAFLAEIFTGVAWQSTDSCGTIDMLRVHIYTIHIYFASLFTVEAWTELQHCFVQIRICRRTLEQSLCCVVYLLLPFGVGQVDTLGCLRVGCPWHRLSAAGGNLYSVWVALLLRCVSLQFASACDFKAQAPSNGLSTGGTSDLAAKWTAPV